jgi:hypothetical protein
VEPPYNKRIGVGALATKTGTAPSRHFHLRSSVHTRTRTAGVADCIHHRHGAERGVSGFVKDDAPAVMAASNGLKGMSHGCAVSKVRPPAERVDCAAADARFISSGALAEL